MSKNNAMNIMKNSNLNRRKKKDNMVEIDIAICLKKINKNSNNIKKIS